MTIAPEVRQLLEDEGVDYEVVEHPVAYTAAEEAAASHISGYNWAKTVVLLDENDEPLMAVLPASYQVDVDRLGELVGGGELRLAEESEFAPLYPNCEPGAMPPLGVLYDQPVFVETRLTEDEEIVFNAGDHKEAVRMRYDDFERIVKPTAGDFGRGPGATS